MSGSVESMQDAVAGRVILILDESLLSNPLARPHTIFYVIILLSLLLVLGALAALVCSMTSCGLPGALVRSTGSLLNSVGQLVPAAASAL